MASPAVIGGAGIAATAAGGLVSGIGSLISGNAAAAASRYKAGVALLNAQINKTNANWAVESGGVKSEEAGLKSGQEIGQTKAVQASSGFDVNTGSNDVVRSDQTKVAQFDQNVIQWNAAKTAWGFESKAATDQAESTLDLAAASTEQTAGEIGMASSFLSAGGSVASKWYQASSTGMFSGGDNSSFDPQTGGPQ